MKKFLILVLLSLLSAAVAIPATAQNRISVQEHERQVRKAEKKQRKAMKKAAKKERKANKKALKAQRKAMRQAQERAAH